MKICSRGYNCCQTGGIELSKCVYLASMGEKKIEHIVGVQNKDFFQNAYLTVVSTETLATTKVKTAKNLCFSLSKLNDIHEK